MMPASVNDLRAIISAQSHIIRVATTDRDNADFYQRSKAQLEASICTLQKQLADLIYRHDHADEIIAAARDEIRVAKAKIIEIETQSERERLLKLIGQHPELLNDMKINET